MEDENARVCLLQLKAGDRLREIGPGTVERGRAMLWHVRRVVPSAVVAVLRRWSPGRRVWRCKVLRPRDIAAAVFTRDEWLTTWARPDQIRHQRAPLQLPLGAGQPGETVVRTGPKRGPRKAGG
jgi:hypothetical protein